MGRAFEVRKASMLKTSIAKSKVYSKYGKEIYMAAKSGQPDPELNANLKRVVDRAKKEQVPATVIQKAIDKAKGGGGEDFKHVRYEGFGPNNSMIIVDCLTDNDNRTVANVRNCFTKSDSKMGVTGCVSHMFDHNAILSFKGLEEEEVFEALLERDCEVADIETEDGIVSVYADHKEYFKIKTALEEIKGDIEFEVDEITWIPQNYVTISEDEDKKRYEKLMNMLNEDEDVQEVYHNIIVE